MSPKILFYNWVPAFDPERRGGGVAVYQDNCILAFLKNGWQVHSLSAGTVYDAFGNEPYLVKMPDSHESHSGFIVVNSPVAAPSSSSFYTDHITAGEVADEKISKVLRDFIRENGPYKAIHFNNIEGLPARVLIKLRQEFPGVRFVFSLHNYYPFCPQVYLWKNDSKSCDGKEDGDACVSCVGKKDFLQRRREAGDVASAYAMSGFILDERSKAKFTFVRRIFRLSLRIIGGHKVLTFLRRQFGNPFSFETDSDRYKADKQADYFKTRERIFAQIINDNFDAVLCVSERVKLIAESFGLQSSKCKVSYIGTAFYNKRLAPNKLIENEPLRLAFLGYANKVKGFDFLLNALEQCSDRVLGKISLTIAARGISLNSSLRLSVLAEKLNGMKVQNGYNHGQLGSLLKDVELGVVPVVWEDCLPQVAIEFVCHGVPVITSNLGGAREIGSNAYFEFNTENCDELVGLIEKFADNKQKILDFWNKEPLLRSMDAHVSELMDFYNRSTVH